MNAPTTQLATAWTSGLRLWLRDLAASSGFDAAGVAPVASANPQPDEEHLDAARFAAWIEAGRAGEMEYLKRRDEQGILLRSEVQIAIPWAESVIVCALNYNAADRTMNCPGHYSRFDCEAGGQQVWGQATQNLPQYVLHVDGKGDIYAEGVDELLYGRLSNVL